MGTKKQSLIDFCPNIAELQPHNQEYAVKILAFEQGFLGSQSGLAQELFIADYAG